MIVDHDYKTIGEKVLVEAWIDDELGIESETTEGDNGEGTIVLFDVRPSEFKMLKKFLRSEGFIDE